MDKMSARLRGDTASHVASLMLARIGYFSDPSIEADFLANAALCLRVAMYCPRDSAQRWRNSAQLSDGLSLTTTGTSSARTRRSCSR